MNATMSLPAILPLTRTEVESAVRSYWSISASKQADRQQDCYAENALIFTSSSRRVEPGRLVLVRRRREYMATSGKMRVDVGHIDVEMIGANAALAIYTMQFEAEKELAPAVARNRISQEHLKDARVTHVFVRQNDGRLKIVHEHISVADA
jgi:ketosteroid isomerase-like protein